MSSNLKVNTILPSTGTSIGIGTAGVSVGINSASPTSATPLEIHTNASSAWKFRIDTTVSDGAGFYQRSNGEFEMVLRDASNNNNYIAGTSGALQFVTTGTERLRILNDGKVGINSSIPTEALEVRGNIYARGATSSDRPKIKFAYTNTVIRSGKTEGNVGMDLLSISGNDSRDDLVVSYDGKIGIGTTTLAKEVQIGSGSTTSQLQINGHGAGFDICSTSGDIAPHYQTKFVLYNGQLGSGVERFRVNATGHVTSPQNVMFSANGGPSDLTNATIIFPNAIFQRGGTNYNTSTGVFTAPTTGIYHIMCNPYRYSTSDDSYISLQRSTNNGTSWSNEVEIRAMTSGAVGWNTLALSQLIDMNAGWQLRIYATNRVHTNGTLSRFSGMLVG